MFVAACKGSHPDNFHPDIPTGTGDSSLVRKDFTQGKAGSNWEPIVGTNIDTAKQGSFYGFGGAHASATSGGNPFPTLNAAFSVHMIYGVAGDTNNTQLAFPITPTDVKPVFRAKVSGVWGVWKKLAVLELNNTFTKPHNTLAYLNYTGVDQTVTPDLEAQDGWTFNNAGTVTINNPTSFTGARNIVRGVLFFGSSTTTKVFGDRWIFTGTAPASGRGTVTFVTDANPNATRYMIATWTAW